MNLAVANYTRGDETWSADDVDVAVGDIVRFKIYVQNRELPESGNIANDILATVEPDDSPSRTLAVRADLFGANVDTIGEAVLIRSTTGDSIRFEPVPGSVEIRRWVEGDVHLDFPADDSLLYGGPLQLGDLLREVGADEVWVTWAYRVRGV